MSTPQRQIGYLFDSLFDQKSSILNRAVQWNVFLKEGHRRTGDAFEALRFDNNLRNSLRSQFIDEFENLSGQQTQQQFRADLTGLAARDIIDTELGSSIAEEVSFRQLQFGRGGSRNLTEGFFDDNSGLSRNDQSENLYRTLYDFADEDFRHSTKGQGKRLMDRMEDIVKKLDTNEKVSPSELGFAKVFHEAKADRLDADATMERVNFEFDRFIASQGEDSLLNKFSASGRAYVRARQQLKNNLVDPTRNYADVNFLNNKAQMENDIARGIVKDSTGTIVGMNRAEYIQGMRGEGQMFINKPGVLPFMSLFESANNRIDIDVFQLQNKTVMAYLMDVIQRKARTNSNFQVNIRVAYPRNFKDDDPTVSASVKEQAARDKTTYAILGPNIVELMKLGQLNQELMDQVGDKRNNRPVINIEMQDRKYHPKLFYTDEVAMIGTANLTNPVGSSINQAGANFEQMLVVRNKFTNDQDLINALQSRYNSRDEVSDAEKRGGVSSDENLNLIQTLLHRQITQFANRNNEQRNALFSTKAMQTKRGQFGTAGEIQEHLQATLDTLEGLAGKNSHIFRNRNIGVSTKKVKNGRGVAMFMVLDQSYILNYAKGVGIEKGKVSPTLPNQSAGGEMGPESDEALRQFMTSERSEKWRRMQRQVMSGLARNLIVATVDAKNYRTTVLDPLVELINKDTKMRQVYQEHGMDFRRLAASSLYDGGDTGAIKAQHQRLIAMGFTDESVRMQIMAMASGNIRMAGAPKMHSKSFGLFEYERNMTTGAIIEESMKAHSFYLGSSNLGQFSLAFAGDQAIPGRQNLVNTEYGFMVGSSMMKAMMRHRRKTARGGGANLAGADYTLSDKQRSAEALRQIERLSDPSIDEARKDYSLTTEQEWNMMQVAMRQMVHTWSQLGNNQIYNSNFLQPTLKPLWESNVDVNQLGVLKTRLEKMAQISDMGTAFQVFMKQGAQSESYKTLQVNIDLAKMFGESSNFGDIAGADLGLRRITFEMTVLNSGRAGQEGNVLFLKQNKLISNSLFHNRTSKDIPMMFGAPDDVRTTNQYGANTYESRDHTWQLKSGHAARLSSLDTTVYLLGTLIHESLAKSVGNLHDAFEAAGADQRKAFYEDYVVYLMTGQRQKFVYDDFGNVKARQSAREFLLGNTFESRPGESGARLASLHDFEMLRQQLETRFGLRENQGLTGLQRAAAINPKKDTLASRFVNTMSGAENDYKARLIGDVIDSLGALRDAETLGERNRVMEESFYRSMEILAKEIPEVALDIMSKQDNALVHTQTKNALREIQQMLFEPFGRFDEIQKYGGNQISSKTLLLGLNAGDEQAAMNLTTSYNPADPNIAHIRGFNRLIGSAHTATTKFSIGQMYFRGIADASLNSPTQNAATDYDGAGVQTRGFTQAYNTDLFSSLGIGTVTYREDVVKFVRDNMEATTEGQVAAIDRIERALRRQYARDGMYLTFYTGDSKKMAQLPQRIKNAAGARPLMAMTVDAQKIYDRAAGVSIDNTEENMKQLFARYLYDMTEKDGKKMGYRARIEKILKRREGDLSDLKALRDANPHNEDVNNQVRILETSLDDAYRNFFDDSYTVGAIFGGTIKKVVSNDQAVFIEKNRGVISEAFGIKDDDWVRTQDDIDKDPFLKEKLELGRELLRVVLVKHSLANAGVGNLIAGTQRNGGHSIALIQLGGLYIDTFYANPDFGSVGDIGNGVRGLREGYFQEMTTGLKAGMVGNGGVNSLLQDGDMIAYDADLKKYVHTRNGMPAHEKSYVSPNNTIQAYENVVENDMWSRYNRDGALGTTQKAAFTRVGESSVEHIYRTGMKHGGSFEKNEMYYMSQVIRSVVAGTGRRVEGSVSGALVKGVAAFVGGEADYYRHMQKRTNSQMEPVTYSYKYVSGGKEITVDKLSYWEYLAEQINRKYATGQIGGSMAAEIGRMENQRISHRMISGLYNPNNFKSFLWSHGSVVMRDVHKLNALFQDNLGNERRSTNAEANKSLNKQVLARRLAASLVIGFGTGWILQEDSQTGRIFRGAEKGIGRKQAQNMINAGVVSMAVSGELGVHYQSAATAAALMSTDTTKEGRNRDIAKMLGRVDNEALDMSLLSGLDPTRLLRVLTGGAAAGEYAEFVDELQKLTNDFAGKARNKEYINIDDPMQRTAAAIVSTMDFMHQVADDADMMVLPTDIDWNENKIKNKLLAVLGVSDVYDPERQQDYIQMLIALSQKSSVLMANLDVSFSLSKDPTGAQRVARHEYQHLVKPMMGDIKAFGNKGDLAAAGKVIGTFHAALAENSALQYLDNTHLRPNVANIFDSGLFSSEFFKRQFIGFYFSYEGDGEIKSLVKEYKALTSLKVDTVQEKQKDGTIVDRIVSGDYMDKLKKLRTARANKDVKAIARYETDVTAVEQRIAEIEMRLAMHHSAYLADPAKNFGVDNARAFLNGMDGAVGNKTFAFEMPGIEITMDNTTGQRIARANKDKSFYVYIPSAKDIKTMGMQWGDFVDDMISNYKNVIMGFAPGTMLNNALEKLRAHRDRGGVAVTADEAQALMDFQYSASQMLQTLAETAVGTKAQAVMGGKTKYQGFTATGIGSWLAPSSSILLPKAKLEEAGLISDPTANLRVGALNNTQDMIDALYMGRTMEDGTFSKAGLVTARNQRNLAKSRMALYRMLEKKLPDLKGGSKDFQHKLHTFITNKGEDINVRTAMFQQILDVAVKHMTQGSKMGDDYFVKKGNKGGKVTIVKRSIQGVETILDTNAVYKVGMNITNNLYKQNKAEVASLVRLTRTKLKIYDEQIMGLLDSQRRAIIDGLSAGQMAKFREARGISENFEVAIRSLSWDSSAAGQKRYEHDFNIVKGGLMKLIGGLRKERQQFHSSQSDTYVTELRLRDAELQLSRLITEDAKNRTSNYKSASQAAALEMQQARISVYTDLYGRAEQPRILAIQGMSGLAAFGVVNQVSGNRSGLSIYSLEGHIAGNVEQDRVSMQQHMLDLMSGGSAKDEKGGKGRAKKASMAQQREFVAETIRDKIAIFERYDTNVRKLAEEIDTDVKSKTFGADPGEYSTYEQGKNWSMERPQGPRTKRTLRDVYDNSVLGIAEGDEELPENIERMKSKHKILFQKGRERSATIQNELQILKQQAGQAKSTKELKVILGRVENLVVTNDFRNLSTGETFRSPPFGGTDPRMIGGFRYIEDINTLNQLAFNIQNTLPQRYSSPNGIGGMITYDPMRGQTAMMASPVGRITANLGDWDGDPYSSILQDMTNDADEIQKAKAGRERLIAGKAARLAKFKLDIDNEKDAIKKQALVDKRDRFLTKIERKLNEVDQRVIKLGNHIEEIRKDVTGQLQGRMKKQLASYMGVNEDYFTYLVEGEDERLFMSADTNPTMDGEALYAFLEFGRSLFGGIDGKGERLQVMHHTLDTLFGFTKDADQFFEDFNKVTGRGGNNDGADQLRRLANKRLAAMDADSGITPHARQLLEFISYQADDDQGEASALFRNQLADTLNTAKDQMQAWKVLKYQDEKAEMTKDDVRQYMNHFIGGELYNRLTATEEVAGMFKKASGMTMEDVTFDTLVKTLGKAGGEVLGKAYNTLVGTLYADSPILALHGSINRMTAERQEALEQAISARYDRVEDTTRENLITQLVGNNKSGMTVGQAFRSALQQSNDFSVGLQAYLKNINQLLRDSIKFKSGTDMMDQLRSIGDEFNEKEANQADRDKHIRDVAYHLGPGGGIIGLIRLQSLVNNEEVNVERLRSEFGIDAVVGNKDQHTLEQTIERKYFDMIATRISHRAAKQENQQYLSEEEVKQTIAGLNQNNIADDITGNRNIYRQVAKYQTAQDMIRMVSSFRFEKALDAGAVFANQIYGNARLQHFKGLEELAKGSNMIQSAADKVTRMFDTKESRDQARLANEYYTEELTRKYGLVDAEDMTKVTSTDLEAREALAEYLLKERARTQIYKNSKEGLEMTKTYRDQVRELVKGDERMSKLALFDEIYTTTRDQTVGWLGDYGQGLDRLTTVDKFRNTMSGILFADQSIEGGKLNGKDVNTALSAMKDTPDELIMTLGQLVSQGKLDKQGAVIYSQMMRGALTELAGQVGMNLQDFNVKDGNSRRRNQVKILQAMLVGSLRNRSERIDPTRSVNDGSREAALADIVDGLLSPDGVGIPEVDEAGNPKVKKSVGQILVEVDEFKMLSAGEYEAFDKDRAERIKNGADAKSIGTDISHDDYMDGLASDELRALHRQHLNSVENKDDFRYIKKTKEVTFMEFVDDALFRTGPGQQARSIEEQARFMGTYLNDSQNNQDEVTSYAKALMGLSGNDAADNLEVIKSNIYQGMAARQAEESYRQGRYYEQKQVMKNAQAFRRGSMSDKLTKQAVKTLTDNRKLNTLESLVPIALTVVGSALMHGRSGEEGGPSFREKFVGDMQTMVGSTIMAFGYSRAGAAPLKGQNLFKGVGKMARSVGFGAAISGTYKLKNAVYSNGGDYASAVRETIMRDVVAAGVNATMTPMLNKAVGGMMGLKGTNPTSVLHFDKHMATKQASSSVISAITSAVVSNIAANVVQGHMRRNKLASAKREMWDTALSSASENIIAMEHERVAMASDTYVETEGGEQEIDANIEIKQAYYSQNSLEIAEAIAGEPLNIDSQLNPAATSLDGETAISLFESQRSAAALRT